MRFISLLALLIALAAVAPATASPAAPADLTPLRSWTLNMPRQMNTSTSDPRNPQILYSWGDWQTGGFAKSTADGQTWQPSTINNDYFTLKAG